LREAILAYLPRLSREAENLGKINIQDRTEGGRAGVSAHRWIAVGILAIRVIASAKK
jgi:hypothetical protein